MSALLKLTLKAESCAVHPNSSCTEQLWTCGHDVTYPGAINSVPSRSSLMLVVGRVITTALCCCSSTVHQTSGSSGSRTSCRYLCKADAHAVAYACSDCAVSILYRGSVLCGDNRASNLPFNAKADDFRLNLLRCLCGTRALMYLGAASDHNSTPLIPLEMFANCLNLKKFKRPVPMWSDSHPRSSDSHI